MRAAASSLLILLCVSNLGCSRRSFAIWGAGSTISHRAEFAAGLHEQLALESGFENPQIGFKYEYFSLFFLDLWTGEGEYVLYEGDRYFPLSEEQLATLGTSADELGKPFMYRVPLGWIPLVILLIGFGVRMRREWQSVG